ncbi:hypothetical protein Aduo_008908 [Ancylostoma duodenale]
MHKESENQPPNSHFAVGSRTAGEGAEVALAPPPHPRVVLAAAALASATAEHGVVLQLDAPHGREPVPAEYDAVLDLQVGNGAEQRRYDAYLGSRNTGVFYSCGHHRLRVPVGQHRVVDGHLLYGHVVHCSLGYPVEVRVAEGQRREVVPIHGTWVENDVGVVHFYRLGRAGNPQHVAFADSEEVQSRRGAFGVGDAQMLTVANDQDRRVDPGQGSGGLGADAVGHRPAQPAAQAGLEELGRLRAYGGLPAGVQRRCAALVVLERPQQLVRTRPQQHRVRFAVVRVAVEGGVDDDEPTGCKACEHVSGR